MSDTRDSWTVIKHTDKVDRIDVEWNKTIINEKREEENYEKLAPMGLPGRGLDRGREAKMASRISPIFSALLSRVSYATSRLPWGCPGGT
jgi:hypothetical protein